MRVTTNAYTGNYLKNNNTLLGNLLKTESRILSQRKYNRASEDSVSAAKAAHVRKALENLDIYDENCNTAKSLFYAAEDALYDIANKTYINIEQKVISIQDTKNQTELDIVAQEITELADHMIQDMNSDFAGRQMFGATSNDKTPFEVYSSVKVFDADGNELAAYGNPTDTAETIGGTAVNAFFPNDPEFYTAQGEVIPADYTGELYDKNGNRYDVSAENGTVKDVQGNEVKVYLPDHVFYDENGEKIADFDEYKGTVYYDSADIEAADTVKFTVNGSNDRSGKIYDRVVCFNDVPINMEGEALLKAVDGGTMVYYDKDGNPAGSKTVTINNAPGTEGNAKAFPGTSPIYVDIGLGINYSRLESTALDMSLNGAEITGCGTDEQGDAYNLMQLVYDAAKAMRDGDRASVNRYIDKLESANTKVLNAITDLGIKQNNMDYYVSKNDVYRISLLEKQNDLEGCDLEEEITNWKTTDAAYNAALSMGSQVLPKSLFDFI